MVEAGIGLCFSSGRSIGFCKVPAANDFLRELRPFDSKSLWLRALGSLNPKP